MGCAPSLLTAAAAAASSTGSQHALLPVAPTRRDIARQLCAINGSASLGSAGEVSPASTNRTAHEMRTLLVELGAASAPLDATAEGLHALLGTALRVHAALSDGALLDNASAISAALASRWEPHDEGEGAVALAARLAARVERECFLLEPRRRLAQSLALEDLQAACAERLLTSSGSRAELISRLFEFQTNCDVLVALDSSFVCTLGRVKDSLAAHSLSRVGPKEELIARLVQAVRSAGGSAALERSRVCESVSPGPVCVSGGRKVLAADAAPAGLLARFSFDDSMGLDSSGMANHADLAASPLSFGPGVGGVGHSAAFHGANFIEVPNHPSYSEAAASFTLELWLYLRQDSTGDWRTIAHKGGHDEERTPSLFLEPLTRGVEFFVSTTDASQPKGERVWSTSFVPLHRWTHLAAVAEGHSLRLYVNGMLDAENTTVGTILQNTGPLRVGGDPWRPAGGFEGLVDELRLHARALSTDEIQAAAALAFGGVEPSFVELGCMGCPLETAQASCRAGYHLCNFRDLYSGGFVVARTMGWATSTSTVWTAEEVASGGGVNSSWDGHASGAALAGLGLCCADNE